MSSEASRAVSAFFSEPGDVDRAIGALVGAGVPRDLVEVVVSPEANRAHYRGRARRLGAQTVRYAGAGALIGLLAGAVLSLEIILVFPGVDLPASSLAIAQFAGPNVGMMLGAILGGVFGAFRKRRAGGPLARALGRDDILVVARSQAGDRASRLAGELEANGGRDVAIEDEPTSPSRRRYL